jgi:hypothetical protein
MVQAIQNVTRMGTTRRCMTKVTKQRHSQNTRTCQRFHRSTRLPQTLHQVRMLIFSTAPTAGHTSDLTRGNPSCHAAVLTTHSLPHTTPPPSTYQLLGLARWRLVCRHATATPTVQRGIPRARALSVGPLQLTLVSSQHMVEQAIQTTVYTMRMGMPMVDQEM